MQIISEKKLMSASGEPYYSTVALVSGDDEVTGWASEKGEYRVGDKVEVFFHDQYNRAKMRKGKQERNGLATDNKYRSSGVDPRRDSTNTNIRGARRWLKSKKRT